MGTDVHAIFQAREGDKWKLVESEWDQRRHYFLFSWLANVRNGYGFAGIPTYAPIKPIDEPRGFPDDFRYNEPDIDDDGEYVAVDDSDNGAHDLGDHSFSWLTADEILSADRPKGTWDSGIITREQFDQWDGCSRPRSYCGGISGRNVVLAPSPTEVDENTTHVRVWWINHDDGLDYFVDEIRRLKDAYGDVRMVFGFDS